MSSVLTRPSTKASHAVLYRRLLFPSLPQAAHPPPLLPGASAELNAELYDLVALALRAYVAPWWSRLTRYDRDFVPHAARVLGAAVRALAARLAAADAPPLLFRALPALVAQHCADYRAAAAKRGTAYAAGGAATLPQLFHQLQGHMGIDAEGRIDPVYLRHTLDLILQACLPAEDQESDAERAIIREVVAKVVSKDVVPTLCQPWFIHKLMLDQLRSSAEAIPNTVSATETPVRATGPSINTAIIFVLSAVQYLSGLCLTLIQLYKQAVHTVKVVNSTPELPKTKEPREFGLHLLRCASEVLNIRERVTASAVFDILEALLGVFDSFIDRLLIYLLQTFIMTEHRVITIVKLSKQTLFPGGYPGPPPVIPTPEEQVLLKEQLVRQIEEHIPSIVSTLVLGPAPAGRETIVSALEPLSSEACNAHLVVFLLDLLVLALFPELGAPMPVDDDDPPSPSTDAGDAPSVLSRRASSLEEGEASGSPGSPLSMGD